MNTNNRELKMTRTVRAPIDLVWKVWTEPEYIAQWWGPDEHTTTIHEMDFREGGEWKLTLHNHSNSQDYPNRSVFKEIIPFKKIVFEHFNPHFIATVIFESKGEETQIEWGSLFDTEEMLATVINVFNAKEGQKQNFERLEKCLEQKTEIMNSNLLFDFYVNKENNTIHIQREFNANLELVWQAWTTAELLDQWWAPKPYHIKTKLLDLRAGGMWLYAMVSPQDEKMWCKADYKTIETNKLLSWSDAFCDENGNENTLKPCSFWTNNFTESNGITSVNITLKHNKPEDIEMMIKMGFKEGLTMALGNLDELLSTLKNK